MKLTSGAQFGEVWEPENFAELTALIVGDNPETSHVFMWRGQADERWLLHSGAFRRIALTDVPNEEKMVLYELRLIENATHRGFRFLDGRELSDFELLARLQHHGAATRLIDTTRNALIGVFFACRQLPNQAAMLFGIHCHHLGGGEGTLISRPYKDYVASIAKYGHPQTWQPTAVSPRIAAQHSQFVYSGVKTDLPHGSLAISNSSHLLSIRITAELKAPFLRTLKEGFDISEVSMFPDLDGFGAANSANVDQFGYDRW